MSVKEKVYPLFLYTFLGTLAFFCTAAVAGIVVVPGVNVPTKAQHNALDTRHRNYSANETAARAAVSQRLGNVSGIIPNRTSITGPDGRQAADINLRYKRNDQATFKGVTSTGGYYSGTHTFATSPATLRVKHLATGTDVKTRTDGGRFDCFSSATLPTYSYYYLDVMQHAFSNAINNLYLTQTAYNFNDNEIYTRRSHGGSGTWTNWARLANSENAPFLATDNAFSGTNAFSGESWFSNRSYFTKTATALDAPAVYVYRNTSGITGGTGAYVNPALSVYTKTGSGSDSYEWAFLSQIDDHSTTASENVAVYGQANAYSTAKIWASCFETIDRNGANPAMARIGMEINMKANGADSYDKRIGIDVVAGKTGGTGDKPDIAYGIRVGAQNLNINNALYKTGIQLRDGMTTGLHVNSSGTTGIKVDGTNSAAGLALLNGNKLGVGIATPTSLFDVQDGNGVSLFNVSSTYGFIGMGVNPGTVPIHFMTNPLAGAQYLNIIGDRSNYSGSTRTTVADGNITLQLIGRGFDGTSFVSGTAKMQAVVDGAVSTGVVPQDWVFSTGATSGSTERMRIYKHGPVKFSCASTVFTAPDGRAIVFKPMSTTGGPAGWPWVMYGKVR